jgi:hypothetical protein
MERLLPDGSGSYLWFQYSALNAGCSLLYYLTLMTASAFSIEHLAFSIQR